NGAGQGGWWLYNTTSDTSPAYGPPGVMVNGRMAEANAGWDGLNFPGFNPFAIPLGAYPTVQSPWGLLDMAGGTFEWTEEVSFTNGVYPTARRFDGSAWGGVANTNAQDFIGFFGGDFPSLSTLDLGFRIAAAIPNPAGAPMLLLVYALSSARGSRRRQG
ncbi:MAG: hypothetical protein KIT68_11685, partial [Phycisphaeraceae bacterium]|nr:hypothetical protein [Phycisphaeraceae bacterium]